VELQGYLSILRARWRVITSVTVVSLLVALLYTFTAQPTYVASSSVFLSASIGRTTAELSRSFPYAQGLVRSYSQVATQPVVLTPVIQKLGLNTTPARLARSITAQAPLDTVIVDIEVRDSSPTRARDIANEVAAQLAVNNFLPGVSQTQLPVKITTLTQATVPSYASSPRKSLNLGLALAIGLLLGAVLAISRDALDVRIRSGLDATAITKVPVIGSVADPVERRRGLLARLGGRSDRGLRELDKQLRTNFQYMRQRRSLRTVVFTSALSDDATGTTVSNLATDMGEAGLEVLIVDADIRRPTLAERHGLSDGLGLTSILIDELPLRTVIRRSQVSPVWVLSTGPELRDPNVMMDDAVVRHVLDRLAAHFEIVLVKAPPVLRVADAVVLGRVADGVVVVADEVAMNRDVLTEEMDRLSVAGANVLGFVLTRRA
jgi:tyrosine-protein kinase